MADPDPLSRLRHQLSSPLAAILAQTQLLLLDEALMNPDVVAGLREIEALALRMRGMLRDEGMLERRNDGSMSP